MNIIDKETTYEYSTKYHAIYQRKYKDDPFKSAIQNIRTTANLYNRYHNVDEDIKNTYRKQRQENNKRAYLIRKNRLAEEANIKANITL